jgi:uncharacterized protein with GYD domain
MPTYIILSNYTQKGIENIKESPNRLDTTKSFFREMGAELKAFYLVQGRYDVVVVAEASNDETISKLSLAISSLGNVRTETLRAYTETEFRNLVTTLP